MFQLRFLMRNLKSILKIIGGDGGSREANAVLTEVGVGDFSHAFNHDDWLQNHHNKTLWYWHRSKPERSEQTHLYVGTKMLKMGTLH